MQVCVFECACERERVCVCVRCVIMAVHSWVDTLTNCSERLSTAS